MSHKIQHDSAVFDGKIVRQMITLLREEIKYLAMWQQQELSALSRSQMRERSDFIKMVVSKIHNK